MLQYHLEALYALSNGSHQSLHNPTDHHNPIAANEFASYKRAVSCLHISKPMPAFINLSIS
jgi:hypothetical protein